jgi:DNA primase
VKDSVDWERFYTSELGPLKGHGVWRDAVCPFHADKHPSLRVNIEHGGYRCMACGASGDGLAFLQQRDGMVFSEALRSLEGFA